MLIAICLIASTFTGCSSNGTKYSVDKVVITYVKSPLNVPSIVEKAKGSFEAAYKELGLEMGYSDLNSGADQTAALASGDIQILNAVGGTSVLLSAANGADIKIISMYSRSPKAFMMFSNDASITSPEALRGKTIGGPKGTNLHELLVAYLRTGNMTINDVNFVQMDIPSAQAALENGSIDAALLAGANAYNCQKSGKHLVTNGEGLISATIVTATTSNFYKENKDLVDAFIQVQDDTLDFIEKNHDEAMQLAAEATELDISAVEEMYPMYNFSSAITDEDIASLKSTQQFLLDNGMIESTVDIDELILKR